MKDTVPNRSLVLVGAGGHADVVRAAAEASGWRVTAHVDTTLARDAVHRGLPILGGADAIARSEDLGGAIHVAIGDNATRMQLCARLQCKGVVLATIVHPAAFVDPSASLGPGSAILAGAIVNPLAKLACAVVVNTGAIVEHHCAIADGVHVAPGAVMGGHCRIGTQALIGLGARLRDRVTIGACARIGAGAAVIDDVEENTTVVGVPAKRLRSR